MLAVGVYVKMDVPPPVPKHRSQANSHQVIPLRDCEWYWASISR